MEYWAPCLLFPLILNILINIENNGLEFHGTNEVFPQQL